VKFSDQRLPSPMRYGSRKRREGSEWFDRLIASAPKKVLGAAEKRP